MCLPCDGPTIKVRACNLSSAVSLAWCASLMLNSDCDVCRMNRTWDQNGDVAPPSLVDGMLHSLQSVPWCRIDVSFKGTWFGFAHNNIQVRACCAFDVLNLMWLLVQESSLSLWWPIAHHMCVGDAHK